MDRRLVWALPKGRILKEARPLLEAAGLDTEALADPGRRLVVPLGDGHEGLLLKPWDVATYVELGVAQLGIAGSDVLRERKPDVYEPVDLGIGRCRLSIAAPMDRGPAPVGRPLRVASKYVESAREHFRSHQHGRGSGSWGAQVDIVKLYGSVELGAVTGLADYVVDLVSSGATLRDNRLEEIETIAEVSSRLVVNRVALRLHAATIRDLCRRIEEAIA